MYICGKSNKKLITTIATKISTQFTHPTLGGQIAKLSTEKEIVFTSKT